MKTRGCLELTRAAIRDIGGNAVTPLACFVELALNGDMTQDEIAEATGQTPATCYRAVGVLLKKGLATRGAKSPADQQTKIVRLTDAGWKLMGVEK